MHHPAEGVLRRLLDEPSGVALSDREHIRGCQTCLAEADVVRRDAEFVRASISPDTREDVDLGAAWQRLARATAGTSTAPRPWTPPASARRAHQNGRRFARFVRRPSVAALAVAVALGGASAAAANDWLRIFATEQVAPVTFTTADLVALPDLSAYGDLAFTEEPDVHEVPDAETAAAETSIDVPEVTDLPRGVSGRPVYQVGGRVSATFTFSADRAAEAATTAGQAAPPPPAGLEGSSVRLVAGPGVAQVWQSDAGAPALVVGRAVAPTAFSAGLPFEVLRDYLLSVPGLPDDVAGQLRAFTADGSTLPLPVPSDEVTSTSADVNGSEASVLVTRNRAFAAVVWVDDRMLNVVAGSLDDDEVLSVARELG